MFQHYGMTETGLGGGVECEAFAGYHLREADLYYEVVDPNDGRPVPDGEMGEVVFTTLTREGMPLIRYCTGDFASFIPSPCSCQSILRRMSPVRGRMGGGVSLGGSSGISMPDLDEAVFAVSGVMNYQAEIYSRKNRDHLKISVYTEAENSAMMLERVYETVTNILQIRDAVHRKALWVDIIEPGQAASFTTGAAKRLIMDRREETTP